MRESGLKELPTTPRWATVLGVIGSAIQTKKVNFRLVQNIILETCFALDVNKPSLLLAGLSSWGLL